MSDQPTTSPTPAEPGCAPATCSALPRFGEHNWIGHEWGWHSLSSDRCIHCGAVVFAAEFYQKRNSLQAEAQGLRNELLALWKEIEADEKELGVAS